MAGKVTDNMMHPSMRLLFEWESISSDEMINLTKKCSHKMIMWLARIHPDNKTRENLLRFLGIKIGKFTTINAGIYIHDRAAEFLEIGERCAIADNVTFITSSHPNMSKLSEIPVIVDRYIEEGKIVIEDDAWIGSRAIIFPNVVVGRGAIVGAGAIVKESLPPHTVSCGQPAKIIRRLPNID